MPDAVALAVLEGEAEPEEAAALEARVDADGGPDAAAELASATGLAVTAEGAEGEGESLDEVATEYWRSSSL